MILSFIKKKISTITLSQNIKNGAVFSFFSFFNQGINFLVTMLLVTILSQEDFGNINLFNTLVTVLATLIPLGTTAYIATKFFVKRKDEMQDVFVAIYVISFLSLFILFIILLCTRNIMTQMIEVSFKNQIIAIATCYFQLFSLINLEMWRLQEKPIRYGIYTTAMVVVNVGITLFLILEADLGWMGRVYAMLGSNLIFFLISIYILYKHKWFIFKIPNLSILKEVLLFGLPLVPHTLTIWMRQGVDRYIINYCWDLTSVAVFSFAINLSSIIQIIGLAFNASNSVYIYKTLAEKHNDFYHKLFKQIKLMTIFFVVVTIVIYFLSRIGITYFIPKYADSIVLLLPLSLSALFQCVYLLFVNFLFYYGKTKKIMYITVGISVLHVALSLIFSKYSIIYTAYINLLSTFAICCLIILSARKEITKQYI